MKNQTFKTIFHAWLCKFLKVQVLRNMYGTFINLLFLCNTHQVSQEIFLRLFAKAKPRLPLDQLLFECFWKQID